MINQLSLTSIFINPYFDDQPLASATGFIIEQDKNLYLVTNWHVISGRSAETCKCLSDKLGVPNILEIFLHKKSIDSNYVEWEPFKIPLYSESGKAMWLEHPDGCQVDVVLLPIVPPDRFMINKFDFLKLAQNDIVLEPAMSVSVIGFPLGKSGGGRLPIWVTGFIASEPEINVENRPMLYVNAPGRSGLSGAPVMLKADGNFRSSRGWEHNISRIKFIGINSGRLESDKGVSSDICRVWKPVVIEQILNQKTK